jgi:hypothetical protein
MSHSTFREAILPYHIQANSDGTHTVRNRQNAPIFENIRFEKLTPKTAAKISFNGSEDISSVYLYWGGAPPKTKKLKAEYFLRLALLCDLSVTHEA